MFTNESISLGGARRFGFSLGAPGDPDVFASLTAAQQAFIVSALSTINAKVTQGGTSCATWADPNLNLAAAVGCFQSWYNANYVGQAASPTTKTALRTDGAVDAATVCAVVWLTTGPLGADFPTKFPQTAASPWINCTIQTIDPGSMASPAPAPAPTPTPTPTPTPAAAKSKGMSTGAKVAVGAAGAAALAGLIYAATR